MPYCSDTGTGSANTWQYWMTTTANSCTTDVNETWITWSTSSTTTISTDVWINWTSTAYTSSAYSDRTPKQAAEDEQRRLERVAREQERIAKELAEREAAVKRAEELLIGALKPEQLAEYKEKKHFTVVGRSGGRYRIRHGRVANVDVIDREGFVIHRLCAHPIETVPNHDTMLAQKLHLEHLEEDFLKIANRHPIGAREQVLPALH